MSTVRLQLCLLGAFIILILLAAPAFSLLPPKTPPLAMVEEDRLSSGLQAGECASEEPQTLPGVVIEDIPKGSTLETAGLQVGDVILSWERLPSPPANPGAAQGELTSYFEWLDLEVEQAPRGTVVLRGRRSGEALETRVKPGVWAAKVRPVLPGALREIFDQGRAQFSVGYLEGAVETWKTLASNASASNFCNLRTWILLRLGELLDEKGELEKAIEFLRSATEVGKFSSAEAAAWEALGNVHRKRGNFDAAERAYNSAFELHQRSHPQSLAVAADLYNQGVVAWRREELLRANEFFLLALDIQEHNAPESAAIALSLTNLGVVSHARGELMLSRGYYLRALRIYEQLLPEGSQVARTLNALGSVAEDQGELDQAALFYSQGLQIRERIDPGSLEAASSLNNLGNVAHARGELGMADEYHLRSLRIKERLIPQSLNVAISLNNLGNVARSRWELDRSQGYHLQALRLRETLAPESLDLASSLANLGLLSLDQGNHRRANDYLLRSLQIKERFAADSLSVAFGLNNLGNVAKDRGDLKSAEAYYLRALRIKKKLAPESLAVASTLTNLGELAFLRGDLGSARRYFLRSLQIKEGLAPQSLAVASSLHNLGELAFARKAFASALEYHLRALTIREQLAPQSLDVAQSLRHLGGVAFAHGESARAYDYYLRAMESLEHQLSKLGGSYYVQAGFRAQHVDFYLKPMDILLANRRTAEAFYILERSRAQTFLAMLVERDRAFTADIPEKLVLERRRHTVKYNLLLKKLADLNHRDNEDEIEATRRELRNMDDEAGDIEVRIRQASSRFDGFISPKILRETEVRKALDTGTLLLSYSVGQNETVLFVLSSLGGLEVKFLPLGEVALRSRVERLLNLIRMAAQGSTLGALRQPGIQAAGRELYDALLGPITERIAVSERLLILPDGPLHALPFAALVRNIGAGTNREHEGRSQYLAEWKPLHVALSATVFAELKERRRPASNSVEQTLAQLAAFGDPIYPQSLARLESQSVASVSTATEAKAELDAHRGDPIVRSAQERGIFDWQPLPHTRREVEGIARLFPPGTVRTFLGSEALEERIKSLDPNTRILHLAAHGYTDEHLPSSSFVALTIPADTSPDGTGLERDNGLLQVWEIFERVRLDADLVVLSACDTALGEEQGGEGLIGLTRAFQYAGARTVMASLWSVQDQATSELMIRFYKHLRAGLSKDEALRQAQLELIRGPIEVVNEKGEKTLLDASAPYYWAGFQVYGDWQ